MGTPNSGLFSLGTVTTDAHSYYRDAVAAVPACVRQLLKRAHPTYVWGVQRLNFPRYGVQFGAWRIRFAKGSEHHAFDWAVLNTGRADLIDVFVMGIYDEHWKDISASRGLGGSVLTIERQVLANAIDRARRAASAH